MNPHIIKKRNHGGISEILFFLILALVGYGCYLYIPLVYKSQELEAIAKDYTFRSGTASIEYIREAVVEDAKGKLDITLNPDDVIVIRDNNRTRIQITWRPVIELPMNIKIPQKFVAEYDRKQL